MVMKSQNGKSLEFFANHPVFPHGEFTAALTARGRSPRTANNLLAWYLASGRLVRVRRGLYAVVPRGTDSEQAVVDPYLTASNAAEDAVIAYHAALQFYGKVYSIWRNFHFLAGRRGKPFSFRGQEFIPVQVPSRLRPLPDWGGGVVEKRHAGGRVRVTTFERAMVDVLAEPARGGGWEEIWRSLEMVEFFDLDAVVAYVKTRGSALTAARVGFFIDQHRETLMAEDKHLNALRTLAPSQPRYFDRSRRPGKLVPGWNLVVPEYVLHRRWEDSD